MWAVVLTALVWKPIAHEFLHKDPPRSILTSQWTRYSPGQSGISLLLPGEPQPEPMVIPESLRSTVKEVHLYSYAFKDFHVEMWDTLYIESVPKDFKHAVDSAVSNIKQSAAITEYQDTISPITISGRSGILLAASFKRHGTKLEFKAVMIGDDSELRQVIITYSASDRDEAVAAQRVLDSIQLEN